MPADERQSRADEIYSAALKQDAVARAEFVRRACGHDTELRREIESRLGYEETLYGFLETPALETVTLGAASSRARSLVGETLGPYTVLSLLGAGGMGQVYQARDTRLRRLVALKTLQPDVTADPERKRRLLLEAQAASALNDPHIVALYDVGNADGIDFLVMEYVPGETLDKLTARGGLGIEQTLAYAVAVAGAVATAHQAGIVHRDLKPGNIMITGEGAVKVLDFGLAKLTEATQAGAPDGAGSLVSMAGLILGTAAYMSPEQAQGQLIDARSDIFSFGVVLYEMLTGQRPFQGDNRTSTLAAVVQQEPKPLTGLNAKVPAELERVVLRCLRKDPHERFQDMADVKAALVRLQLAAVRRRLRIGIAAAVIAVLLVGAAAYQWLRGKGARQLAERQITANPVEDWVAGAAISPDGKRVAYRDQSGFLVREIDGGETRPIPVPRELQNRPPEAVQDGGLQWFPGGDKLLANFATREGSAIWVVPVLGDAPPHMVYSSGTEGAISPDGRSLAFVNGSSDSWGREIWVGGVDGRPPQKLVSGETFNLQNPTWSPDGRWIAYQRSERAKDGSTGTAIEVRPAGGGPARTLASESNFVRSKWWPWWGAMTWAPDWRLIFAVVKDGLWELRVDPTRCEARGNPEQLVQNGSPSVPGWLVQDEWLGTLTSSADGRRLAFMRVREPESVDVGELGEGGSSLKNPHRLTLDDRASFFSGWTRDSKAVLFSSNRNGKSEIFKQGVNEAVAETVASSSANAWFSRQSADGAWFLYWEQDPERPGALHDPSKAAARIMRRPAAGGPAETVLQSPPGSMPLSCPLTPGPPCAFPRREGNQVIFYSFDPVRGLGNRIGQIEYDGGSFDWDLSPDGSRLVVVNGRDRVELLTLRDRSWREIQVEPPGGQFTYINWMPDGIGFVVGSVLPDSNNLLHVTTSGKADRLLSRGALHTLVGPLPSPDGKYLAFQASRVDSNVWMIENF